ncbi:MAG: hypothetical protein M1283_03690 [Gammaproteobacteria bacterium]|nr:hypothetical protein [Gammaproteobacteria bacterium]
MLDELTKTIKAQLYERATSPLLSSFLLSWLAWNYRFVIVLLSSMPVTEKITYVDTNIFQSYQEIALRGALYPLLTALLLIFVYPIPAKYVYEYWRKRQRELKEIQQRIDDETPLTREEARELRRETIKATSEYEQELERRSAEIARLREMVAELQRSASSPKEKRKLKASEPSAMPSGRLDAAQVHMLEAIAKPSDGLAEPEVISSSRTDKLVSEYNLGELLNRDFVTKNWSSRKNDYNIKITHSGRTYLINHARGRSSSTKSDATESRKA